MRARYRRKSCHGCTERAAAETVPERLAKRGRTTAAQKAVTEAPPQPATQEALDTEVASAPVCALHCSSPE